MKVRAQVVVEGRISEAEELWYDLARWPAFVDGFHHVVSVAPEWPSAGTLVWQSTAGGRGIVSEDVERHEPRGGQMVRVEDPQLDGTQSVSFAAVAGEPERIRIALELDYRLKTRHAGPLGALVDFVFIRPRQREAVARTLLRFRRELEAEREMR